MKNGSIQFLTWKERGGVRFPLTPSKSANDCSTVLADSSEICHLLSNLPKEIFH